MTTDLLIRLFALLVLLVIIAWYYYPRRGARSLQSYRPAKEPIVLHTPRLVIRDVQLDDFEQLCTYLADPEVHQQMLADQWQPWYIRGSITASIQNAARTPRFRYGLVLVVPESKEVIGSIVVEVDRKQHQASIGWDTNKQYWRKGLTTEAASAVVELIFTKTPVSTIIADCNATNIASIRVMEKLGMYREHLAEAYQRELRLYYGVLGEVARHVITREVWIQQQEEKNLFTKVS